MFLPASGHNPDDRHFVQVMHSVLHRCWDLYIGESKIIRTIGTCFAVGYTAGWA